MAKAKGKYHAVLGGLPALGIDPSRRDAVTQVQEQIKAPLGGSDRLLHAEKCERVTHPNSLHPCSCSPVQLTEEGTKALVDGLLNSVRQRISQVVELKKRQTAGRPYAAEYARAYAECRAIRDTIAEWDGAFSLLVEAYQWLMIDQLEVEGTRSLKLSNGASISTFEEPQAKVEDAEKFRQWCMTPDDICMTCGRTDEYPDGYVHQPNDDGTFPEGKHAFHPGGGMTNKMQLPWGTTNALTKEMLLAGAPEPDGVSVWKKTVVRLGAGDE